ncbi:hypothetical protein BDE02_06G180100 [Populus trichocarpa]|nr:hypothetical protein BDE02_06G180100 [Populus trichocarpa]
MLKYRGVFRLSSSTTGLQPTRNQKHQLLYSPLIIKRELVCATSFLIVFDLFGPFDPLSVFRFGFLSQILSSNEKSSRLACDYSHGRWVRDESNKNQSYTESCPFLDPGFRCVSKWKKVSELAMAARRVCELLERSRNGGIVFAGDSVGRNQWEPFLCMLAQGVSNKSSIHEEYGNPMTKHTRAPFLPDHLHWFSKKWEGADVLVVSTGHWGYYFEDKGKVTVSLNVMEAFKKSLQTPKLWIENLNPERTRVFWLLSSTLQWDEGGRCDMDRQPLTNYTMLEPEPVHNQIISTFLNITHLTQFSYDGHPSRHREPGTPVDTPQDCSHWCLPGIPDIWNEILYANLLSMGFRTK